MCRAKLFRPDADEADISGNMYANGRTSRELRAQTAALAGRPGPRRLVNVASRNRTNMTTVPSSSGHSEPRMNREYRPAASNADSPIVHTTSTAMRKRFIVSLLSAPGRGQWAWAAAR